MITGHLGVRMETMSTKTCTNCNGEGKVWNERTQKNDKTCPACDGKGYVITGNV